MRDGLEPAWPSCMLDAVRDDVVGEAEHAADAHGDVAVSELVCAREGRASFEGRPERRRAHRAPAMSFDDLVDRRAHLGRRFADDDGDTWLRDGCLLARDSTSVSRACPCDRARCVSRRRHWIDTLRVDPYPQPG